MEALEGRVEARAFQESLAFRVPTAEVPPLALIPVEGFQGPKET